VSHKFYDGQELKCLFFTGDGIITAGEGECDKLTVSLEHGAAWFVVWKGEQAVTKWNANQIEGVLLPEQRVQ
jgi:hypothetical protein